MQLLLTSGECIPVPLTVARLRQPQTSELLQLMNTYVFLPRFERCYRMLEQSTGREVTAEVWATLPTNAVLIALTCSISGGSLHQGQVMVRRRTLSSVQRRRQPTSTSLPPGGTSSSSNNSRGASSRSPGQDQYARYAQHLAEYTQSVLRDVGLADVDVQRLDVSSDIDGHPNASGSLLHHLHHAPAHTNNGSLQQPSQTATKFISCVVGEITVPRGDSEGPHSPPPIDGSCGASTMRLSPVHRNGSGTPNHHRDTASWPTSATGGSRGATPQHHAHRTGTPTTTAAPPMHRAAVSLVSAIARDKGAALLECMFDIIDQRERDEASVRSSLLHPLPRVGDGASQYPAHVEDESTLVSAVPRHLMERLMDMGFSQRLSCRALLHCSMDPSAAVDHVLHMSPDDLNRCEQPMMPQEIEHYATLLQRAPHMVSNAQTRSSGHAASMRPGTPPPPPYQQCIDPLVAFAQRPHHDRSLSPSQPMTHHPRGTASMLTVEERAKRADFTQLLDMGFNAASARMALRATGGDFNEACAALLGDPAAATKLRAYQHDHHHSGGTAQASTHWFEPIEVMVKDAQLHPHNVVDVVRAVNLDPQNIVLMWHCGRFGPTVARMAAVFSTSQTNRTHLSSAMGPPMVSLSSGGGGGVSTLPTGGNHVWTAPTPSTSQPSSAERQYRR